ncbi:ECF RNA polymerase sigma factor SigL [Planctomycetes bacterium CA13]|uniref:ECF RNA polymerase sigma factor SigL n=1 Tax=Novipirellula herctigrandis TaxID=2527986 RepID=A0A5C5ZE77_9BACT|nr:ECF RNA polymerase sigma factor SigL [Planctomycetes bacterium CA13]
MIQDRHAHRTELMLKPTPGVKPSNAKGECELTLRELFDTEEAPLLRYAFALTGHRSVAEEIVQEVFLLLHTHWDDVDAPKAWLMRCVRNKAFNFIRDKQREVSGIAGGTSSTYTEDESPEEMILRMEATGIVRQMLLELDEPDRQLVKLKYFEDLKYSEICDQTGLSIGNVGYRLHHILKELAVKLRPLGIDGKS